MSDSIYRQELLEIIKSPIHKGVIENPSVEATEKNAFCGDIITFQLSINSENIIEDVKFSGEACAVATASAELLAQELVGKTAHQASKITKSDLLKILGINLSTSRVKCAVLPLETLNAALKSQIKKENE